MKWLLVVLWSVVGSDGNVDAYVFTTPTFDSKEQCVREARNPAEIKKYISKLVAEGMFINKETGQMQPIDKVVCAQADKVMAVIRDSQGTET